MLSLQGLGEVERQMSLLSGQDELLTIPSSISVNPAEAACLGAEKGELMTTSVACLPTDSHTL